jgi:hypothetical protein
VGAKGPASRPRDATRTHPGDHHVTITGHARRAIAAAEGRRAVRTVQQAAVLGNAHGGAGLAEGGWIESTVEARWIIEPMDVGVAI